MLSDCDLTKWLCRWGVQGRLISLMALSCRMLIGKHCLLWGPGSPAQSGNCRPQLQPCSVLELGIGLRKTLWNFPPQELGLPLHVPEVDSGLSTNLFVYGANLADWRLGIKEEAEIEFTFVAIGNRLAPKVHDVSDQYWHICKKTWLLWRVGTLLHCE